MAAKQRQNCEENLEEQLAKIDPATLQCLEQLLAEKVPAVRKIVQNVLDEPISQEMEKHLHKPLLPKPFQPRAPPQQRSGEKKARTSEGVRSLSSTEHPNSDRLPE